MPKLELKAVQRELEQAKVWPFYWIYGPERLKSRELLKRLKKAIFQESGANSFGWNEETFDGNEAGVERILDSALSPSLGGGTRLILIREAHTLKNPELLSELLGDVSRAPSPMDISELSSVCVCLAKDLDGRKKFSKLLLERAAVIACDEVLEQQRESWVLYLAKRKGLELPAFLVMQLCTLDPWNLDILDLELEKLSIDGIENQTPLEGTGSEAAPETVSGLVFGRATERFLESFFLRDLKSALAQLVGFVDRPDESLPLLGLLGWNVRHLALFLSDRALGTRHTKLSPFLIDRFRKWSLKWQLQEVLELQKALVSLDFQMKQSPLLALGIWSQLVTQFCREHMG